MNFRQGQADQIAKPSDEINQVLKEFKTANKRSKKLLPQALSPRQPTEYQAPFPSQQNMPNIYPRPTLTQCEQYIQQSRDNDLVIFQNIYQPIAEQLKEKMLRSFFYSRQHYITEMHKRIQAADQERVKHYLQCQQSDFEQVIWKIVYKKYRLLVEAKLFGAWKKRFQKKKKKNHKKNYCSNYYLRHLTKTYFTGWRKSVQADVRERMMDKFSKRYEEEREAKVQVHENKVHHLRQYFESMQKKLRVVIEERQQLTRMYEASLNKGVGQLNKQTDVISKNPLVTDVNLQKYITQLVANQFATMKQQSQVSGLKNNETLNLGKQNEIQSL